MLNQVYCLIISFHPICIHSSTAKAINNHLVLTSALSCYPLNHYRLPSYQYVNLLLFLSYSHLQYISLKLKLSLISTNMYVNLIPSLEGEMWYPVVPIHHILSLTVQ